VTGSSSTSYTTYGVDSSVTSAWTSATSSTLSSTAGGGALLQLTNPDASQTVYTLLPPTSSSVQSHRIQTTTTLTATAFTIPSGYQIAAIVPVISNGVASGIIIAGTNVSSVNTFVVIGTDGATASTPLSACSGYAGTPSALAAATYQNVDYVAVGSNSGSICIYSGDSAENMSSQAPSARYTAGNVNSLGFYPSGSNLLGYWDVVGGSTNVVYRVTGTATSSNVFTGTSFWNATSSTAQTSTSGSTTVTFSNVPATVNSSFIDNNGNEYVGTTTGSVYKLANGFYQWTNTSLTGATSAVYLGPTSTGSGVVATTVIGGTSTAFVVN